MHYRANCMHYRAEFVTCEINKHVFVLQPSWQAKRTSAVLVSSPIKEERVWWHLVASILVNYQSQCRKHNSCNAEDWLYFSKTRPILTHIRNLSICTQKTMNYWWGPRNQLNITRPSPLGVRLVEHGWDLIIISHTHNTLVCTVTVQYNMSHVVIRGSMLN